MQEDWIDTLLPRKYEYKEKFAKFQGKELGSIHILKKQDKISKEHEEAIINAVNMEPPSYPYIKNIPYINYNEESLTFMGDKRKENPKYDQKDGNAWIGTYIIKKKFEKDKYYLIDLDGRKISLPMDGCLLWPYIQGTWLLQGPGPR
jgi:hypothetical protein